MAGSGALILLLDEIATMVKVAAQKTTTISDMPKPPEKDDGAQLPKRHNLSVIIEVAGGSLRNKAILAPAALALNFLMPWAVLPLLAAGGVYFSYEGVKKLKKLGKKGDEEELDESLKNTITGETVAEDRRSKVKKAIKTDMILSGEIIAVTLAAVAAMPVATQALALGMVSIGATLGVYTVIAGIIKMEDLGGWLAARPGDNTGARAARYTGRALLAGKPHVMNGISAAGSAAIFIVGGGLLFHGIPAVGHYVTDAIATLVASPYVHSLIKLGASFVAGLTVGAVATPGITAIKGPVGRAARSTWDHLVDFFWIPPAAKPNPQPVQPINPPQEAEPAQPLPDTIKPAFENEAKKTVISPSDPDVLPAIKPWSYNPYGAK